MNSGPLLNWSALLAAFPARRLGASLTVQISTCTHDVLRTERLDRDTPSSFTTLGRAVEDRQV